MTNWKNIAIILIIIVIIESVYIIYINWLGYKHVLDAEKCFKVCEYKGYVEAFYDFNEGGCYCFDEKRNKFKVEIE